MRGAKPKNLAFSVCPRQFHEILALFEAEVARGAQTRRYATTRPKEEAEKLMAECFGLSVETVKDAKRGRGPYARGKPCTVSDCDGKKNCLLHGEAAAREIVNRKHQSTTKLPH